MKKDPMTVVSFSKKDQPRFQKLASKYKMKHIFLMNCIITFIENHHEEFVKEVFLPEISQKTNLTQEKKPNE